MNQSCRYCCSSHWPRICVAYGKKLSGMWQDHHFREVCRGGRNRTIHDMEQEPDHHHEEVDHTVMANINSVYFKNKHSVIETNLNTLSKQTSMIVTYKVDIDCIGNIMPLHIYRNYFLGQQKNNWWQTKTLISRTPGYCYKLL